MAAKDRDMAQRQRLELSVTQVAGSALAATTSAVAASTLGVAGTLAGAAVGSVVATVGGAVYTHTLRRTGDSVRTVVIATPAGVSSPALAAAAGHTGVTSVLALETGEPPEPEEPRRPPPARRAVGRRAFVGVAAAAFVLALGGLSAAEVIAGRPVADIVSGSEGSGTTVGSVVRSDPSSQEHGSGSEVTGTAPDGLTSDSAPGSATTPEPDQPTQTPDPSPTSDPEATTTPDPAATTDPGAATDPGAPPIPGPQSN